MSSYRQTKTLSEGIDNLTDTFKPQMTSLIDILTLLLVFLIQSFNAEGTLVTQSPDLELPVSSSNKSPAPSLTIEVTRTDVEAEGQKLAAIDSFKSSKDMLIGNVFKWLLREKSALWTFPIPHRINRSSFNATRSLNLILSSASCLPAARPDTAIFPFL